MISPHTPITKADLYALATLANTKLAPATPFKFTAFAGKDQIGLPADITVTPTYGGTGELLDGTKQTIWLYGYKTAAGEKTYSWTPLVKAFQSQAGFGQFTLQWDWVSVADATVPDGYLVVIPWSDLSPNPTFTYYWKDIGSVQTLTLDGTWDGTWKLDESLVQSETDVPCSHGTWLKMLNRIREATLGTLDVFGGATPFDDTFKISGPWCVSVPDKCYLQLNGKDAYTDLQFWYSETESMTGNQLSPEAELLGRNDGYMGAVNGDNSLTWDVNVKINGVIRLLSEPAGQAPTDWDLTASHPGITTSFDPSYLNNDITHPLVTALVFTLEDVQFTVGTPVVLTATPLSGGSVIAPGNPFGDGCLVDATFTGDAATYPTTDNKAIHLSGINCKVAALDESLPDITLHNIIDFPLPAHYRSLCKGVFVAKTLPTFGQMTYLDVDLPQYTPSHLAPASTRRTARTST